MLPNNGTAFGSVYSSALLLEDYTANLNSGNAFSKPLVTPSGLGYDVKNHYVITSIKVDTLEANTSKDITGHIVTCINKKGKLYEYRSRDFSSADLLANDGTVELSVLIPPQANGIQYEIRSYVYIDGEKKMKLLKLSNSVLTSI